MFTGPIANLYSLDFGEPVLEALAGMALEQPDAASFSLGSAKDSLDLFDQFPQRRNNGRARKDALDFAERYREGELDFVIELAAGTNNPVHHLVFFAIPNHVRNIGGVFGNWPCPNHRSAALGGKKAATDRLQKPVESLPSDAIKCNDEIVPSGVRLERVKQRHDVRREIFASSPHGVLELSGIIGNGKMDEIGSSVVAADPDRVGGLIEGGTQSLQSLVGNVGVPIGDLASEFDFVRFANAVRVRLDHSNVGLFFVEPLQPGIECTNVMFCPRETALGAGKGIAGHV